MPNKSLNTPRLVLLILLSLMVIASALFSLSPWAAHLPIWLPPAACAGLALLVLGLLLSAPAALVTLPFNQQKQPRPIQPKAAPNPTKAPPQTIDWQAFLADFDSLARGQLEQKISLPQAQPEQQKQFEQTLQSLRTTFEQRAAEASAAAAAEEAAAFIEMPSSQPTSKQLQPSSLAKLAQQLEKLTGQLLGATDNEDEQSDDIQQLLISLKLQAHKLSDETVGLNDKISFLKDLSEQSSILALNAAIQASRSGEEGVGAIADELQRLANRHADTSRQMDEGLLQLRNDLKQTLSQISNGQQQPNRPKRESKRLRDHIHQLSALSQKLSDLAAVDRDHD